MKKTTLFVGMFWLIVLAGGASASAATDYYLKIGDVKGEAAVSAEVEVGVGAERENVCYAECRNEYGGSGSAAYDACIRNCGTAEARPARQAAETGTEGDEDNIIAGGSAVSASAVEVRGWDPKQKQEFLATVKVHAQVQSEQDLENFAKGVLLRDEQIEAVVADEERVEVRYRMPAKFLGVFNASLTVRAEVDAEGRVKVRYPWFSFLFQKLVAAAELEAEVEAALPGVGDEVLVGFEHRAQVMQSMSAVMKSKHEEPTFCTADAMQCPDGSWVGRTGPNCEFVCP